MTHGNPPNRSNRPNQTHEDPQNQNPPNPTQDAAIYLLDTNLPRADGEYRATYRGGGVEVLNARCVALVLLFELKGGGHEHEDEREEWFGMRVLAPDTEPDENATVGCFQLCVAVAAHVAAAFGVHVPEGMMDTVSFQGHEVKLLVRDGSIVGFTADAGSFHCDDLFSDGRLPA